MSNNEAIVARLLARIYTEGVAAGRMHKGTKNSNAFAIDAHQILTIARSSLDTTVRA